MHYVRPNPFFSIIDLSSPSVSAFCKQSRGARRRTRVCSFFFFFFGRVKVKLERVKKKKRRRGAAFRGLKAFAVNQLHEVNRGGN